MKLLFLGMPGVGKGTYAQVLEEALGIPHISSGDLLRAEVEKGTYQGNEIKKLIDAGKFVPDETIIAIIEERIAKPDCKNGFILDGFPRTQNQAHMLKELIDVTKVLHFKANDEVIIERLSGRIICKDCQTIYHLTGNKPKVEKVCDHCQGSLHQRDDDQPEVVKKRLQEHAQKTAPLLEYYEQEGLLIEVVINKPIHEIRDKVVSTIKDFLEGKISTIGEIK
jgi:adenylate kinase